MKTAALWTNRRQAPYKPRRILRYSYKHPPPLRKGFIELKPAWQGVHRSWTIIGSCMTSNSGHWKIALWLHDFSHDGLASLWPWWGASKVVYVWTLSSPWWCTAFRDAWCVMARNRKFALIRDTIALDQEGRWSCDCTSWDIILAKMVHLMNQVLGGWERLNNRQGFDFKVVSLAGVSLMSTPYFAVRMQVFLPWDGNCCAVGF